MEHPDDAFPPPYSVTDKYATSTASALRSTPVDPNADDASVTTSSSHSKVIYTPPETPDGEDEGAAAGGTDASPVPAPDQTYFGSRPAAARSVHAIPFAVGMTPADLPYPDWAADRHITKQDWHDFVHGLFPPQASEHLTDGQLWADREGAPSQAGGLISETLLDSVFSPDATSRLGQSFKAALGMVRDWNEGFFAPRGVALRLNPALDLPGAPLAWDQAAPEASLQPPHQLDCSGPTGRHCEVSSRGRGLGWGRGRGMPAGVFSGATRGGWGVQGVQGEPGQPDHHEPEQGYMRRGRYAGGPHGEGHAHRARSRNSVSSDSSSSSSGSDSSVGSLPDGDELNDSQLHILRRSVPNWLQSLQPVSKAEYSRFKSEIRAAEGTPGEREAGSADKRKEIKLLLSQWKQVQQSQKKTRKAAKKAAKKEKKARKRQHKTERKESKRDKKDRWHSRLQAGGNGPAAGAHAYGAFGPTHQGANLPGGPRPTDTAPRGAPPPGAFSFGAVRRDGPGPFEFPGGNYGGWRGRVAFGEPWSHAPWAWLPSDAALHDTTGSQRARLAADRARHDAAANVRRAHEVRAAALANAGRQAAEATVRAHAARDAALRVATASRQGAQAAAAATSAGPLSEAGQEGANMPAPAPQDRARLVSQIHELQNRLRVLQVEGDGELARQFAEEEAGRGRPL